jgi:uncharacterized membrane protein YdjX (TVP38/TMEM64 family)
VVTLGPRSRRRFGLATIATLLGLLMLGLTLLTAALYLEMYPGFSAREFETTIQSWGAWGVIASVALMILHSFVPFPAEFLAIANGMVYGPIWGTVITWTGAMMGAYLAFGLARALGRPFVDRMVSRKHWHILDEWAAARGAYLVLISRFIPVIAFNLVNYAAGLTRISWWTFSWATGIGILPFTVLMVVMGDYIEVLSWEAWGLFVVAGLVLWLPLRGKFRPKPRAEGSGDVDRTDKLYLRE